MPEIVLLCDGKEVSRTPLDEREVSVGRDAANDIVLDDPFVSRKHVVIGPHEGARDHGRRTRFRHAQR